MSERTQMLALVGQDFKAAVIKMFKELNPCLNGRKYDDNDLPNGDYQ